MNRTLLLALAVAGVAPAAAAGDPCAGDAGYVLDFPTELTLGEPFQWCITVPQDGIAFFVIGLGDGPTPTKYGTLCLGGPFAGIFGLPVSAGANCSIATVPCRPAAVDASARLQFVALGNGASGMSNMVETLTTGSACTEPGSFATWTQGGWGAGCAGNNIACTRDLYFDTVFPDALIAGDQDGDDADGLYALVLTSSLAVESFLPDGGPSESLDDDEVDVANSSAGNIAGQIVAAILNVSFDDAGVFDAIKLDDTIKLVDAVYADGVASAIVGHTVGEILEAAHKAISGDPSGLDLDGDTVADVDIEELKTALDVLNNNYHEGTVDNGNLIAP